MHGHSIFPNSTSVKSLKCQNLAFVAITSISMIIDGKNLGSITTRMIMIGEMSTMRGGVAKLRLFKWVRIYAGGDKYRACRVENTNRPAEQIQVSAGNKSTSFWLLDIFAPNWRGQFNLSTLYRRTFECFFGIDMNH